MSGSRYERELVNRLANLGFAVMRAPSSGRGTKRELPDLTADRAADDIHWGIEAKSASNKHIYIDKEKVDKLLEFCLKGGITPRVGGRWKRAKGWNDQGWFLCHPDECNRTKSGQYRLTRPTQDDDSTIENLSADDWPGEIVRDESDGGVHIAA